MNKFKKFLATTTQEAFAREIGVTQGTIGHYLSGRVLVPAERCLLIERKARGAVTRRDLRPDLPWDEIQPQDQQAA